MAFLFVVELWAFLGSTVQTGVILDANTDTLLRINFNVTMLDLPCEYAAVDVVDVMAVAVRTSGKRWYDFVTSICAIVGGTFTTVGLVDAVAHKVLKAGKQL